jgi:hypothetical protein
MYAIAERIMSNPIPCTAVLVEPRQHKALEYVLNNACECLPETWPIVFFHGTQNAEYATNIVDKLNSIYDRRIVMVNLHVDNLTMAQYNELLSTKSILYDCIATPLFLVFQTDSMILKKNKHLIHDFLQYDYVGSPWLVTQYWPTKRCGFIGNGGFSLRNKNKMLEIMEKIERPRLNETTFVNEDLYFSTQYENIVVSKPDYEKAQMFSVDEVFCEETFACHKPWLHAHYETFRQLYPEVDILRGFQ